VSHWSGLLNWILDFRTRGIRVFGELEFWLSSIKVVTLIGMFDPNPPVIVANGKRTSLGLIIFGIIVGMGAGASAISYLLKVNSHRSWW